MPYPVSDMSMLQHHVVSPMRGGGGGGGINTTPTHSTTTTTTAGCVQAVRSPRANHPAMFPRSPSTPSTSIGLRARFEPDPVQALPVVDRKKDVGSNRVAFSWNGAENPAARWDGNSRNMSRMDAEDTIMRRIVETREELGRLQKENKNHVRQTLKNGRGIAAHEGRPLYSDGKGGYNWQGYGVDEEDEEWYPKYDDDEVMLGRWPDREKRLLTELEWVNGKLQLEREKKKRRENEFFNTNPVTPPHPLKDLNSPPHDAALSGWDSYVPTENNDLSLNCSFFIYVGDRFDIGAVKDTPLEHAWVAALETSIAETLRQPSQYLKITYIEPIDRHNVRVHAGIIASRLEVKTVRSHVDQALDGSRGIRLHQPARILKETGRPAKTILYPEKSWTGSVSDLEAGSSGGYVPPNTTTKSSKSSTVEVTVDQSMNRFDKNEFSEDVGEEMGVDPRGVRVGGVGEGVVAEMWFEGVRDAEYVMEKFARRCGDRRDPVHEVLGRVSRVVKKESAGGPKSPPPSPERRRRRREDSDSPRRRRNPDSPRRSRRREEDADSPRRRRRDEDSDSPRRRRRDDSPDSPRRSRRHNEDPDTPHRSRRRDEDADSPRRSRRRDDTESPRRRRESTPHPQPTSPVTTTPSPPQDAAQPQLVKMPISQSPPTQTAGSSRHYRSGAVPASSSYAKAPAPGITKSAVPPPFKVPPSQRPSAAQE